jgi:ferric-dicitrate binding protein FerR (iron transport regulator)
MAKKNDLILRYLLNEMSLKEETAFKRWLESNPRNSKKIEEYREILEKTKNYPKGFDPEVYSALSKVHKKAGIFPSEKSLPRYTLLRKIAAVAVLIIGLTGLIYIQFNTKEEFAKYSGTNEIREIVLPDSSHVWLNEYSSLQVPLVFAKKQRKVILKGEAYFEIKRNEHKPFLISAGNTITKVLGTSFNIKFDTLSGNVSVIVNTGKVEFCRTANNSEKVILTPTYQGFYVDSSAKVFSSVNTDKNYLAWKTGVLTFDNTPLIEVCGELSQHFKKHIKTAGNISDKALTGTFNNEKLEDILNTIQLVLDVKVKTTDAEIIIHN